MKSALLRPLLASCSVFVLMSACLAGWAQQSPDSRRDAEDALEKLDVIPLEPGAQDLQWASYYAELGDLTLAIRHYRRVTHRRQHCTCSTATSS